MSNNRFKNGVKILDDYQKNKNILTESEFSRYKVLFKASTTKKLSQGTLKALSDEYLSRIALQYPVTVVSDMENSDGQHPVIMTLPPMLDKVPTLNQLKQGNLTDALSVASERYAKNMHDSSIIRVTNNVLEVLLRGAKVEDQDSYNNIMDNLYGVEKVEEVDDTLDNLEWVAM